ncbi:MAG: AidA/PixA family protein [Acidobacteriota bacterium]|nr:AidA/PixA family protein [Acidobacteriota bacterium]
MGTRNIFASIDVKGILDKYKVDIINFYGFDPTQRWEGLTPEQQARLRGLNLNDYNRSNPKSICRIGYDNYTAVSDYTRLVSCKDSTIGWKLRDQDIKTVSGERYLTTTYNLAIRAKNRDTIRWWGHTINPGEQTQAVLSDVDQPGSSTEKPPEFTQYVRKSVSFLNPAAPIDPTGVNLSKGIEINSRSTFCIQCILESAPKTISYDVVLLLLTTPFMDTDDTNKYMALPIVKVVTDPTIVIEA